MCVLKPTSSSESFSFQNMLYVIVCVCLVTDIMVSSLLDTKPNLSKLTSDYDDGNEGKIPRLPSYSIAPGRDRKAIRQQRSVDQNVMHKIGPPAGLVTV